MSGREQGRHVRPHDWAKTIRRTLTAAVVLLALVTSVWAVRQATRWEPFKDSSPWVASSPQGSSTAREPVLVVPDRPSPSVPVDRSRPRDRRPSVAPVAPPATVRARPTAVPAPRRATVRPSRTASPNPALPSVSPSHEPSPSDSPRMAPRPTRSPCTPWPPTGGERDA